MAPADTAALLDIEVVYSPGPGVVQQARLQLPAGASVEDALQGSGFLGASPELVGNALVVGVWGKLRGLSDSLRDQDRVEIYRPLKVDPKEARRQRYSRHRAKAKP